MDGHGMAVGTALERGKEASEAIDLSGFSGAAGLASSSLIEGLVDVSAFADLGRQLAATIDLSGVSGALSGFADLGRQLAETIDLSGVSGALSGVAELASSSLVEGLVDASAFADLGRQMAETIDRSAIYATVHRSFEDCIEFDRIVGHSLFADVSILSEDVAAEPESERGLSLLRDDEGRYLPEVSFAVGFALGLTAWVLDAGLNSDASPVTAAGILCGVYFWMRRRQR